MAAGVTQGFSQETGLKQEQTLTSQQIQSLNILFAPVMELQAIISQAMEQNPVLEMEEPDYEPLPQPESPEQGNDDMQESLEKLLQMTAAGAEPGELLLPQDPSDDIEDQRTKMFESIADRESLWEHLFSQLRFAATDEKMFRIGSAVIEGIDESGYLRTHPADIAMAENCSMEEVEQALKLVQTFDPPGIGARDLKECLSLQLNPADPDFEDLKTLIEQHLEDIAGNRLTSIGKSMELPPEAVQILIGKIKKFNPFPGGTVGGTSTHYVIPEAEIVPDGEEYKVIVPEREIPRLRISEFYLEMLNDPETRKDALEYLKEKIKNARELMESLEKRKTTIGKIAELIASEQFEFLKNGVEFLRPMTMKLIADKLALSESTISRAVSNKYIKTPQGVFEFRYFFSGGFTAEDGTSVSSRGVQELIREMVEGEDSRKPLSDSKLTDLLVKRGIDISRRTVAKYREELGIPASHLRKVF